MMIEIVDTQRRRRDSFDYAIDRCMEAWRAYLPSFVLVITFWLLPVSLDEYVLSRAVKRHAVQEGNGEIAVQQLRDPENGCS